MHRAPHRFPVTFPMRPASLGQDGGVATGSRDPLCDRGITGAQPMFKIAILLFAVAAVAGLTMAIAHFRGQTPPKPAIALLHGLFAASGLVVLLLGLIRLGAGGVPAYALGLFLIAALGGFTLLSFHLRGRPLPNGLVVGHALLAVAGFVTLVAAVYVVGV